MKLPRDLPKPLFYPISPSTCNRFKTLTLRGPSQSVFDLAAYIHFQSIVISLLNTSTFSNIDERSENSQSGQAQWFA